MADPDPVPRRNARRRTDAALPVPDEVALVLQGGGALGSYQAGVYEALAEAGIAVDHIAGISIGAVNAAIIAGNPPERQVDRLREYWSTLSGMLPSFPIWETTDAREWLHEWSAGMVATFGVPGFFRPRMVPPMWAVPGPPDALSFYDTAPLADTLNALIDWDLLNDGPVRVSVGAVDVDSGNFRYFDSGIERLDVRHIMASGALPPGLPPVEIDGRWYWDGGLVSNTPLSHVLDTQFADMLVFQVDLFPASNEHPRTIMDVAARAKEIQFSSRTRQVSDMMIRLRRERELIRTVLAKLPAEMADDPDVAALRTASLEYAANIVQLIYRANTWEGGSRDYEFSARTMDEHWAAGRAAVAETMTHAGMVARNILDGKTAAFDLGKR
jgi:NTE family protein